MGEFYRRTLKKLDKLTMEQLKELFVSAAEEISRLEAVLDSHHAAILVCDEQHKLIIANKFARSFLPLKFKEGEKLWKATGDERLVGFFKETLLGNDKVLNCEMDIENYGRIRLVSISIVPLVNKHKITGSLVYITDITEERKKESRLRSAENLASLTTLAAAVAHEIKNPLGSISIQLQLLQKTLVKEGCIGDSANDDSKRCDSAKGGAIEKYFNVLNEEIDRLNRIVVDFLFAVRPITLELRESDINRLILQTIELVRYEMEENKIKCKLELDEKLPYILMDERYMKQVLINLIKNAQAAMPDGGTLSIITNYVDNDVRITVKDTGIGISKENIAKIFEPYFTTKKTGTGLGLTQVFKIIREHRGEISITSKLGKGSDFEIILPIHQKETRLITYKNDEGGLL